MIIFKIHCQYSTVALKSLSTDRLVDCVIGMRIGTLVASSGEVWLHPATGLSEPIQNDSRFRQAVAPGYAPYKMTRESDLRSQLCVQAGLDRGIPSPAERGFFLVSKC